MFKKIYERSLQTSKLKQINGQIHRYLWHCDLKSGHELKSESQAESRNFATAEREREREGG